MEGEGSAPLTRPSTPQAGPHRALLPAAHALCARPDAALGEHRHLRPRAALHPGGECAGAGCRRPGLAPRLWNAGVRTAPGHLPGLAGRVRGRAWLHCGAGLRAPVVRHRLGSVWAFAQGRGGRRAVPRPRSGRGAASCPLRGTRSPPLPWGRAVVPSPVA